MYSVRDRFKMRIQKLAASLVALLVLAIVSSAPASAGWTKYDRHSADDPYAYRYKHRGYYPYYGSDYWKPAHKVKRRRFRFRQPRYHSAWGYYRRHIHKNHHSHPHGTVRPHTHRKHHW